MLFFCIISQNGTIVYDDGSVSHISACAVFIYSNPRK